MELFSNDVVVRFCLVTARVLVGFYFFFFTFWNYVHRDAAIAVIRDLKFPFAVGLFSLGLVIQCITGLLIVFNMGTAPAAALLILFDFFATFIYHRFWVMDKGPVRTLNTIIFIGNLTISLGALLFVMGTATV